MKRVIVIGRNYSTVLGLARSLGEAGYDVRLLALSGPVADVASESRYISKTIYVPFDFFEESSAEQEIKALEELRGEEDKVLIIPARDITCLMLEKHWERMSEHFYFPNINNTPGELSRFSDKDVQKKLAAECGILTAGGKAYSTDDAGIALAADESVFPCFAKPLSSSRSMHEKNYIAVCDDSASLSDMMKKAAEEGKCGRMLVEKKLDIIKELSAYGAAANGNVYLPAVVETLRSGLGTHMGVAAEGIVLPSSSLGDLKEKLENFVKKSGISGLFCIDLAQCNDGIYFLEMNLRMGGSCYAVTMAGANLPAALADMVYSGSCKMNDIKGNINFLSEFIEIDNFLKGLISFRTFFRHMSGCKNRFIKNKSDPKPWNKVKKIFLKTFIRNTAKKILRRK